MSMDGVSQEGKISGSDKFSEPVHRSEIQAVQIRWFSGAKSTWNDAEKRVHRDPTQKSCDEGMESIVLGLGSVVSPATIGVTEEWDGIKAKYTEMVVPTHLGAYVTVRVGVGAPVSGQEILEIFHELAHMDQAGNGYQSMR